MTGAVLEDKEEPFFFNVNNFDDDDVEEEELEEDLPPPPPTFSEAELEAAKGKAFEEGKELAKQEAKAARGELIAKTLESISGSFTEITAREEERIKRYEQDAVILTLHMFKKLFPLYQEKYGFEELKENISQILQKQTGQKEIAIRVAPDATEGIEKFLSELKTRGLDIDFSVSGDETLPVGASKLDWADGGASYNMKKLADEIYTEVEQVLAADGAKVHDGEETEITEEAKEDSADDTETAADEQKPEETVTDTVEVEKDEPATAQSETVEKSDE